MSVPCHSLRKRQPKRGRKIASLDTTAFIQRQSSCAKGGRTDSDNTHDSRSAKQQTKVAVLGLGYIGLPTAAVVARSGAQVSGIDTHEHVVETVNSNGAHIEEVNLDALVQGVVHCGLLRASTNLEP